MDEAESKEGAKTPKDRETAKKMRELRDMKKKVRELRQAARPLVQQRKELDVRIGALSRELGLPVKEKKARSAET